LVAGAATSLKRNWYWARGAGAPTDKNKFRNQRASKAFQPDVKRKIIVEIDKDLTKGRSDREAFGERIVFPCEPSSDAQTVPVN
jgi:hypothetical protein